MNDPKTIIESYVDDIVLRLPARLRKDVGLELRDLLMEELANRSEAAGRAPDKAMTEELVASFGNPGDVAARYRPAGNTIIPAREARVLSWIGVGSVLAQWALSLPLEVILPAHDDFATRLGAWAVGAGMHAFALPGCLAVAGAGFAWWKHKQAKGDDVTIAFTKDLPPLQPVTPHEVNRFAWGAALIGFAIGIPLYAMVPQLMQYLPADAQQTFALDPEFVANRAPWLLLIWALQLAVFLVVMFEGRWRSRTRRADMALNLGGAAMLVWFAYGGDMLLNAEINGYAKMLCSFIALMIVGVTAFKFWRENARVGEAVAPPA